MPIEPKTLDSAFDHSGKGAPLPRAARGHWFFLVAGACSFAVVGIFLFQEIVLRLAPGPSTTDEWLAAPLTTIERLRMALMFFLFFFGLMTYAGVAFRLSDPAAWAGLLCATIGCVIELGYRAVEMRAVPEWAEAYRQAEDPTLRALLRARIDTFQDVTASLYNVIRGAALFMNLCFGAALLRAKGLQRVILLLFLTNALRLSLAYLKPLVPVLEPILDWVFILVLAPLYGCLGVWLWRANSPALS